MSPVKNDDRQYRLLVQNVVDYAIYMLNSHGDVQSWNTGAKRLKNYSSKEIIGKHFACFYNKSEQLLGVPDAILEIARQTGQFRTESWQYRSDGSRFWASVVIDAIHEKGALVGFSTIIRDCTGQRRHTDELEATADTLRGILSVVPYGACLLDETMRIVLCNQTFTDLFAIPTDACHNDLNLFDLSRSNFGFANEIALLDLALLVRQQDQWNAPYEVDFGEKRISIIFSPTPSQGLVATFQDITSRFLQERATLHKAQHDALTGLANRDASGEHIDGEICNRRRPSTCTVIYLDLDKFKLINDNFGHLEGDSVLRETARRIRRAVRLDDFICRLSGDEFIIVPAGSITKRQALKLGDRLCRQIAKPYSLDGRDVSVGVSIGIASFPEAGTTKDELIGNASIALFTAKRGGGGCCVYDEEIGLSVLKRRATELQLRNALAADEFQLHYQPICGTDGSELKGFEALLRWTKPSGEIASPAEFIPLAEELGLMVDIGAWVLDTACREAASWPSYLTVAVNVSATQLHDETFVHDIYHALERNGLDPRRLELEITETAIITNMDRALSVLSQLRSLGILIALDDFGTGYSSLSFLHTLPFTRIKIDRSFVCDVTTNAHSLAIIKGVMRMSQDLGLSVTAEGVETEEQRLIVSAEACQEIQGYLISPPMARDRMQLFLANYRSKTTQFAVGQ